MRKLIHDLHTLTLPYLMGLKSPWASGPHNFQDSLRQLRQGTHAIFEELRSSHELQIGYVRSQSCGSMRSHMVCTSIFRIHGVPRTLQVLRLLCRDTQHIEEVYAIVLFTTEAGPSEMDTILWYCLKDS